MVARSLPEPLTQSTFVIATRVVGLAHLDGGVAAPEVDDRPVRREQVRAVDERVELIEARPRIPAVLERTLTVTAMARALPGSQPSDPRCSGSAHARLRDALEVSVGAERGDRVGRRPEIDAHLRAQRAYVGVVGVDERAVGRQDVACQLRALECRPVDEQRLRVCLLQRS